MNTLHIALGILAVYSIIGVGISLLIAHYKDSLKTVEVAPFVRSDNLFKYLIEGLWDALEVAFGIIILILAWPVVAYAACTWWPKDKAWFKKLICSWFKQAA